MRHVYNASDLRRRARHVFTYFSFQRRHLSQRLWRGLRKPSGEIGEARLVVLRDIHLTVSPVCLSLASRQTHLDLGSCRTDFLKS